VAIGWQIVAETSDFRAKVRNTGVLKKVTDEVKVELPD